MNQVDYKNIAAQIESKIQSGIYKPGQSIPSENALSLDYSTSRTIIRKAIDTLVEKNMVVRQRGVGVFVLPQITTKNLRDMSDIIKSRSQGRLVRKVSDMYLRKAFVYYSRLFGIKSNELIYEVKYTEYDSYSVSTAFEKLYFPLDHFPGITPKDLKIISVLEFMDSGLKDVLKIEQKLELVSATGEVAKELKISPGTHVFKFENHFQTTNHVLIGIQVRYEVAESSKYVVDFSNKGGF